MERLNVSLSTSQKNTPLPLQNSSGLKTEERLKKILQEKNKEIDKLKRIQKEIVEDLEEAQSAISILAKQFEKNTEKKEQQIARHVERKVLPLCLSLKEEGKSIEMQNLEIDILTFQVKSLIRELTHSSNNLSILTAGEMHVAMLIAQGSTSRRIARQLFIAESTVKTHRKNIRSKLGLKNRKINLAQHLRNTMQT